ncbi:hypothetical protein [Actinokineospora iranica]|uniref:Protein phosphatase 2C n=1 Tax=Actinokineospora iranica TaxID=1271860 RepID=A0A1G6QJW2_9PSEU|nr:hypothetical protein [Actinokineospora iranica]SDC92588.1 hypothetical protein SAMN05216174_105337 [Actinokineospora iranica]
MPQITMAEQPGVGLDGLPRPSEDVVVVLPDAVILLDGATSLRPELPSGGAYATDLATQFAGRLATAPELDLADLLAGAIRAVARGNGFTPGASPASTVAVVRWDDATVEALVLADSPVVAFLTTGMAVVEDTRLREGPAGSYRDRLRGGAGYTDEHVAALRESARQTSARRNQEGGYWVAEAVPAAAHHAIRASWPRAEVTSILIASDGVSCGVDDYGLFDWPAVRALAADRGPHAVLDAVRAAETSDPAGIRWPRAKPHDDQALVHIDFTA